MNLKITPEHIEFRQLPHCCCADGSPAISCKSALNALVIDFFFNVLW